MNPDMIDFDHEPYFDPNEDEYSSSCSSDSNSGNSDNEFLKIIKINGMVRENKIDPQGASKIIDGFRNINTVLNVMDFGDAVSDPKIESLINERKNARAQKNWELADKIRDQLRAKGVIVQDPKAS